MDINFLQVAINQDGNLSSFFYTQRGLNRKTQSPNIYLYSVQKFYNKNKEEQK